MNKKKKRTNYIIGRDFEYRVIAFLRKHGYYCVRSYGSKGLYDVIGVPPKNRDFHNYPLLVQAKRGGVVSKSEMERLEKNNKWQGWVLIAYSIPHVNRDGSKSDKRRDLRFRTLSGVDVALGSFCV